MTQPINKQPEYVLQPDGTIRVWVLTYDTSKDGTGADVCNTEEAALNAWFDRLACVDVKDTRLRARWHALHNGEDDEEYEDCFEMADALSGYNDTFNYDEHVLHVTR